MTFIFIELVLSWLLLWFVEKKHLTVLGLVPEQGRAIDFISGLLVAASCCSIYYGSFAVVTSNSWVVNPGYTGKALAGSTWYNIKSVLFEELIFRGAILYILLRRMKTFYACLISAIAFGIYHWFTMGFGNPVQMVFIFITTGAWGYMFALAFARTGSLYLPTGIHLGWNFVNNVVFSHGPQGEQWLVLSGDERVDGLLSLVLYLFQFLAVPVLILWYLNKRKADHHIKEDESNKSSPD